MFGNKLRIIFGCGNCGSGNSSDDGNGGGNSGGGHTIRPSLWMRSIPFLIQSTIFLIIYGTMRNRIESSRHPKNTYKREMIHTHTHTHPVFGVTHTNSSLPLSERSAQHKLDDAYFILPCVCFFRSPIPFVSCRPDSRPNIQIECVRYNGCGYNKIGTATNTNSKLWRFHSMRVPQLAYVSSFLFVIHTTYWVIVRVNVGC